MIAARDREVARHNGGLIATLAPGAKLFLKHPPEPTNPDQCRSDAVQTSCPVVSSPRVDQMPLRIWSLSI